MKIIFVAPRFHTNQVGWVEALIDNGHEVEFHSLFRGRIENQTILSPKYFPPCSLSKFINKIIGEGGINIYRGFPNPYNYFKHLRNSNCSLIIIRDIGRWFSILAAISSRLIGIKIVIYSQTNLHKKYGFVRSTLTFLVLKILNAKWMTPLKGEPDRYVNHPKNMFFIPFAVRISNSLDKKFPNTLRLLSIGKFEERKNHILLIQAFKKLLESGVKSELVLIGEVSNGTHEYHYKECLAYIERESLSQNIKIYKNIENQEIENFYSASDLFILPSTDEPAAISILESLGFGVPSVCSDGNGTRFYLLENDFGRVFEDNSIESLVKELKYMTLTENLEYYNFKVSENVKNVLSKEKFYTDFKNHILDEI